MPAPHNVFYVRPGRTTTGDLKLQYVVHKFFEKKITQSEFAAHDNPLGVGVDLIGMIVFRQADLEDDIQQWDQTVDFSKKITIEGRGTPDLPFF